MAEVVIVGGARTPQGRLLGQLAALTAVELGAHVIRASLERTGVAPEAVGHVVMGQVIQAGCGQNPAKQAAVAAGLGMAVPAETVNKVCLSGLAAVTHAARLIRLGEADVVVAGGMESMTHAPHLARVCRREVRALRAGGRAGRPRRRSRGISWGCSLSRAISATSSPMNRTRSPLTPHQRRRAQPPASSTVRSPPSSAAPGRARGGVDEGARRPPSGRREAAPAFDNTAPSPRQRLPISDGAARWCWPRVSTPSSRRRCCAPSRRRAGVGLDTQLHEQPPARSPRHWPARAGRWTN